MKEKKHWKMNLFNVIIIILILISFIHFFSFISKSKNVKQISKVISKKYNVSMNIQTDNIEDISLNSEESTTEPTDLTPFITNAEIIETNGNNIIDGYLPNKEYILKLSFKEMNEKQFQMNSEGTMKYKLPGTFFVEHTVTSETIKNKNVDVGTYSIDSNGNILIKWNKVDEYGNPNSKFYPDLSNETSLDLNLYISIKNVYNKQIDLGNNVIVDLNFNKDHTIIVNKEAIEEQYFDENGNLTWTAPQYNSSKRTIIYNVSLNTYDEINNLQIIDKIDERFELCTELKEAIELTYKYKDKIITKQIDISNYPESIRTYDGKVIETISKNEVSNYIEISNVNGKQNLNLKFSAFFENTSLRGIQIDVKYKCKLKDDIYNNLSENEGKFAFNAVNCVVATGTNSSNETLTSNATEEVPVEGKIIEKEGWVERNQNGDVNILYYISVGDGSYSLKGSKIRDVLPDGLKITENSILNYQFRNNGDSVTIGYSEDLPDEFKAYKYWNKAHPIETYLGIEDKAPTYNFNTKTIEWNIVDDVSYVEIFFFVEPEEISTVSSKYKNTVSIDGIYGKHTSTSNETTIIGNVPKITKTVEPINKNDEFIEYEINVDIPKEYYKKQIAVSDILKIKKELQDGSIKELYMNYADVEEELRNSVEVYVKYSDENNNEITKKFEQYYDGISAPYVWTFEDMEPSKNYLAMVFSTDNVNSLMWNINADSKLVIKYKVPLSIPVQDINEEGIITQYGYLREYTGQVVENEAIVYTIDDHYQWLGSDKVTTILPDTIINKKCNIKEKSNTADFVIEINKDKEDLLPDSDNIKIIDEMTSNLQVFENTIEVYEYNSNTNKCDIPVKFTYNYYSNNEEHKNILEIDVPDSTRLEIKYTTKIEKNDFYQNNISNIANIEGITNKVSRVDYIVDIKNSSAISGNGNAYVLIKKYGKENLNSEERNLLEGVEFSVYKMENEQKNLFATVYTDETGSILAEGLEEGKYYIKETNTLFEYKLLDTEICIEANENGDVQLLNNNNDFINTYKDGKTTVIEITNIKQKFLELPVTGGKGTVICMISGLGIMISSLYVRKILILKKHRIKRRKRMYHKY